MPIKLFKKNANLFFDREAILFFLEASFELFFLLDNELKVKDVNRPLQYLLGYAVEELRGKNIKAIVLPEDLSKLEQLVSLQNDSHPTQPIRFLSKTGKPSWFELKAGTGDKKSIFILAKEITSQKEMEEKFIARNRELEEEKAKLDAMLENIGDGIIGIASGGEIIFVNPQAEQLLGFKQEEILGKMLIHAIGLVNERGEDVPLNARPIHAALLSKRKVTDNKYFYVKADGTKFPVAITATPVILHDLVIGGVDVFRDITKEREIDRMKTEFISLASHQLRTPLSAMKWFAELLIDDSQNMTEEQRQLLVNIYQSNERMIELVSALLNISRIESGRMIIEPKPTDLSKLVNDIIQELQPKIAEKKQNLSLSIHQHLPVVKIDAKLIRQVYTNLLTNAIKYTPDNGQIIVIISKSDKDIISQISDSGYGIPQRQQKQVFTKFFRADNIIKVEPDGTGLGLYLTKAVVESSGGKMWFKSEEGEGTTFWFNLPIGGITAKKGQVSIDA